MDDLKYRVDDNYVIVIPAYNPDEGLCCIVDELISYGFKKILVVNDGSNEECRKHFEKLSRKSEVLVVSHGVNLGKGRALKTAINHIVTNANWKCSGIITVDADGQHRINDIVRCVAKMEECKDKTLVLGCRTFTGEKNIPLRSRIGNECTKKILSYLCNLHVSDSQTGLRGMTYDILPKLLAIKGERYEYETNMLLELGESDVDIVEVPISTVYVDNNSSSHFNPIKDSIRIYSMILKYSFASIIAAILDNLTFGVLSIYCTNVFAMTFAGRAVAACVNFMINKKIVFCSDDRPDKKGAVFRYIGLIVLSGSISAISVQLVYKVFGINLIVIKIIVETLLYFANFYIQKNYVFKKERINANEKRR